MKELKFPTGYDFEHLEHETELNPEEKKYWEEMMNRLSAQCGEKNYSRMIEFYTQELEKIKGKFGNRISIERGLKYRLGYAHEWLGTHGLEGHEPLERAKMFEKAVEWYQAADETVGFFTDYCLRQAESCGGAAHFRKQAGLKDEVTRDFAKRHGALATGYLNGLTGMNPTIIKTDVSSECLEQIASKKNEGVVRVYRVKDHSMDNRQN